MRITKYWYYFTSIFTMLLGYESFIKTVISRVIRKGSRNSILKLKSGIKFHVRDLMDIWIVKETCLDRDYEKEGLEIGISWNIIDIGAGIGDFSVHASKISPSNTIYAYEPFYESYNLLISNKELNKCNNINAFQMAVGASAGEMNIIADDLSPVMNQTIPTMIPASGTNIVRSTTLEDIFRDNNIERCDMLKIDCEGGEYDILLSANDALLQRINIISLEYHNNVTKQSHTDLISFFRSKGFKVVAKRNPVHDSTGFLYIRR